MPLMHSSPGTPAGTGLSSLSSTRQITLPSGRPIGERSPSALEHCQWVDVDRGFGRAVAVVQLHGRQLRQHAVAQFGGQGFAAGEHAGAGWCIRALSGSSMNNASSGGTKCSVVTPYACTKLRDALRIAVFTGPGQQQPGTR